MAETIDWVSALTALGVSELVRSDIIRTLGTVTKTPDDYDAVVNVLDEWGVLEVPSSA